MSYEKSGVERLSWYNIDNCETNNDILDDDLPRLKRGRPPKRGALASEVVVLRFTPNQMKFLKTLARANGKTVPQFLRSFVQTWMVEGEERLPWLQSIEEKVLDAELKHGKKTRT